MEENRKKHYGTMCSAINCYEYTGTSSVIFNRFPADEKRYFYIYVILNKIIYLKFNFV